MNVTYKELDGRGREVVGGPQLSKDTGSRADRSVDEIPYSYKFSRDIYFADATNSTFLRFIFEDHRILYW